MASHVDVPRAYLFKSKPDSSYYLKAIKWLIKKELIDFTRLYLADGHHNWYLHLPTLSKKVKSKRTWRLGTNPWSVWEFERVINMLFCFKMYYYVLLALPFTMWYVFCEPLGDFIVILKRTGLVAECLHSGSFPLELVLLPVLTELVVLGHQGSLKILSLSPTFCES